MTSSDAKSCKPRATKNSAGKQRWNGVPYSTWDMLQEDIDRQAQKMEETLSSVPSARNQVNRVHQKTSETQWQSKA